MASIRASDAEREQVAHILRTAIGEGRLTLDEGEERLTEVYQAVYRDDLEKLTADLPDNGRQALAELPEARLAEARDRRRRAAVAGAVVLVVAALVGVMALTGTHVLWPGFLFFLLIFGPLGRGRRHRP
jgi:DNA-binding transcriptional regulator YbjK